MNGICYANMNAHISYCYADMIGEHARRQSPFFFLLMLDWFPFPARSQGETGCGDGDDVARIDGLLGPSTMGEPSSLDDEQFAAATVSDGCGFCYGRLAVAGRHLIVFEVLSDGGLVVRAGRRVWLAGWLRISDGVGARIAGWSRTGGLTSSVTLVSCELGRPTGTALALL